MQIKPDIYAVNEDGDKPEKRILPEHGIEYRVLKRLPKEGLPRRESTPLPQGSDTRPGTHQQQHPYRRLGHHNITQPHNLHRLLKRYAERTARAGLPVARQIAEVTDGDESVVVEITHGPHGIDRCQFVATASKSAMESPASPQPLTT